VREREAINPEALKIHASAEQRMMGTKKYKRKITLERVNVFYVVFILKIKEQIRSIRVRLL